MKHINIEQTAHTPKIDFDFKNGIFLLEGKSYSEDTFQFYKPLLGKLEEFFGITTKIDIIFNFNLTYFNSSSSKALFDIFDLIDNYQENNEGKFIKINWIYDEEDESSLEDGEDFQDSFENLNISLIIKS